MDLIGSAIRIWMENKLSGVVQEVILCPYQTSKDYGKNLKSS